MSRPLFHLIPEMPQGIGGGVYVARRNAGPEPDGSWRWQLFEDGDGGGLIGYLQSHECPEHGSNACMRVFSVGNERLGGVSWHPERCARDLGGAVYLIARSVAESWPASPISSDHGNHGKPA